MDLLLKHPAALWLVLVLGWRVAVDLAWGVGGAYGLDLGEAFGGAVVLGAAMLAWAGRRELRGHPYLGWAVAFGLVTVLAAVRAPDLRTGVEHLARWLGGPLLMLAASLHLREERDRRAVLAIVPLAGLLPVVLGWAAWAGGETEVLHGAARVRGAYATLHDQAHAMALLAAVGLFWAVADEDDAGTRLRRVVALAFAAVCGFLLVQTWVRTALLGLGVFVVVFAVLERRWRTLALAGVAAVGIGAAAVAEARFADLAPVVTGGWPTDHEIAHVGSSRGYIWTRGVERWLERPWHEIAFGMGLEQHRTLNEDGLDAHSDVLALLFQAGPVALLAWLAFQALVLWRGLALRAQGGSLRTFAGFLIALDLMVLLANLFSNSYASRLHVGWTFWILGGALLTSAAPKQNSVEPTPLSR